MHYLYCYTDCLEIMYVDSQLRSHNKSNEPMNNKEYVKIHKGIDNNIRFKVTNPDYKKVSVNHLDVRAVIIDTETREKVYEKYLEKVDDCFLYLRVLEGELKDVRRGHYELVIRGENADAYIGESGFAAYEGFYKDQANNITFPVLITSQGDTRPLPSIDTYIKDWLPTYLSSNQPAFMSTPLPANLTRNSLNRTHTFTIRGEEAGGRIRAYGTLEASPTTDDNLWFQLDIPNTYDNEIEIENFTGIQAWSFTANLTWIRFQWIPDVNPPQTGNLERIQYRN